MAPRCPRCSGYVVQDAQEETFCLHCGWRYYDPITVVTTLEDAEAVREIAELVDEDHTQVVYRRTRSVPDGEIDLAIADYLDHYGPSTRGEMVAELSYPANNVDAGLLRMTRRGQLDVTGERKRGMSPIEGRRYALADSPQFPAFSIHKNGAERASG